MTRIVLPIPPDPMKFSDVPTWQTAVYGWGNDIKGKLESYSRAISSAIDSTPIGLQSPASGAFTSLSATQGITGASLSVTDPTNGNSGITLTGTGTQGANLKIVGSGTNPNKTIRAFNGNLQVVNNAYTGAILNLTDGGALSLTGGINATTLGLSGGMTASTLGLSGAMSGTTISLSGGMNGTTLNLSGGITGTTLNLSGGMTGTTLNLSGGVTTSGLNTAGIVTAGGINQSLAGQGAVQMSAGGVSNSGIIGFFNPSGTRVGYAGYCGAGGPINLNVDAGTTGWACNSTFSCAGSMSAGTTSGGYLCKTGSTGGFGPNVFNFYWTGGAINVYIDSTYLGTMTVASDERYKQAIVSLEDTALERVSKLRPVSFRYADKGIFKDDGVCREGLIAQEVAPIVPSAVDGDDPKSLNLTPLVAVSIKALQELTARVAALEDIIRKQT